MKILHGKIFIVLLALQHVSFGQNVGINTNYPAATLDVNGTFRLRGGSPGAGKVLVSDALGNTSWKERKVGFRAKGIQPGGFNEIAPYTWYKLFFAEKSFDYTGSFNIDYDYPARSIFIAPATGVYHLASHVRFDPRYDANKSEFARYYEIAIRVRIQRNASITTYTLRSERFTEGTMKAEGTLTLNDDIRLLEGDRIWLEIFHTNSSNINMPLAALADQAGFSCILLFEE